MNKIEQYEKMIQDKNAFIEKLKEENKELRQKVEWQGNGSLYELDSELYNNAVLLGKKLTYKGVSDLIQMMIKKNKEVKHADKLRRL